jgi:hypothetical protein
MCQLMVLKQPIWLLPPIMINDFFLSLSSNQQCEGSLCYQISDADPLLIQKGFNQKAASYD